MRFAGKVCLVSGAGSGIGKATAKQLAKEGGKVVVIDLNEQHGSETVQEIATDKGEAIFAKCDVGRRKTSRPLFSRPSINGGRSTSW